MSGLILLAVPLFVFLGLMIEMTGLARALVDFMAALLGHVRGGLAYVLLGAMYLVSGISGSKAADMAAVAPVAVPGDEAARRARRRIGGVAAASGAMSETIPPSLVLITIGSVTGVSIAGTVHRRPAARPGGRVGAGRGRVTSVPAATISAASRARLCARSAPASWLRCRRWRCPSSSARAVIEGVATATEVSTVGIVYTAIAGLLFYRQFEWRRLYPDAGRDRVALGRHPVHHRHRNRHGLGAHPIRLLAPAGGRHGAGAGRALGFLAISIVAFIDPGQRAGRHPGDRAVRAAAVPGCARARRATKCTTPWW